MYTVGRIGSYISQGVYTVSAPFHPFGGAVDIIVVEQPDGTFKSSPWYVRFGKFQGVLKSKEKVVSINVNGVDANFSMYLDHKGEAYFLREAVVEEGESASYPSSSSSGYEANGQSNSSRKPRKSNSCNYDAEQVDASNEKRLARTASQRSRILGLVFGRKLFKEIRHCEDEGDINMVRLSSLERAEIAAELLEVKWSTNLSSSKSRKDNVPLSLAHDVLDDMVDKNIQVDDEEIHVDLSANEDETIPNEVREQEDITGHLHNFLKSSDDSQELDSNSVLKRDVGKSPSECSEEEQFLFSDIDEAALSKVHVLSSSLPESLEKGNHPAFSAEGIEEVNGSVKENESSSSSDLFGQYSPLNDIENSAEKLGAISNPIVIHKSHVVAEEVGRLVESLPIIRPSAVKLDAHEPHHPLSHSLDSNSKSLNRILFKENYSSSKDSDTEREQQLVEEHPYIEDTQISQGKAVLSNPAVGDLVKPIISPGGSWRLWPFFRRSRSGKAMQPVLSDVNSFDIKVASKNINDRGGTNSASKPKVVKKKIRVLIPTSDQLSSLNLKEGKNIVTFTFSTPMLGMQQVDARIYLWRWNTRIVISDVDGTITKSDVLGQFMPLVGMDWSQTGVAHLFSAIKENGYQLLFLSARAIAQAYLTRQFLFNLKQDGKALPDGPVVISPDGLFPSLFREVIRRAPHEFKIACLENIKALFPSDCNPFYAGFGNRDTDEISYLKVGIPRGKIFIINPKGEVAVNRRVDSKTYSSLHALVHGMFPLTTSTEQEDFNQWNFWKLPPQNIVV